LILFAGVVVVLGLGGLAWAGDYHVTSTLLCYDCHTMHYSQQHGWAGGSVGTTPVLGGDWLGASGPNTYLLKAPVNQLCQACHDGQSLAPDVVGANANASPTQGRSAGALNTAALGTPYEAWKGHTLDSTATPPGFNPTAVGFSSTVYDPAGGLECISCHTQHGRADVYRNLGPRRFSDTTEFKVTYTRSTTNDTTKDVWINLASYTAGSGDAATFNPFYASANVSFNRNDATVGTLKSSNNVGVFCAACHANFHGGPGDTTVGGTGSPASEFQRHPTAQVAIGALGGGHSNLSRFVGATNKVKVATNDYSAYTNSTPICLSCHKAHGNQNPFGLVFMARSGGTVGEEGTETNVATGMRNLCGQCHVQGN
jgi:hypothetical protein